MIAGGLRRYVRQHGQLAGRSRFFSSHETPQHGRARWVADAKCDFGQLSLCIHSSMITELLLWDDNNN